jgi:predicted permease
MFSVVRSVLLSPLPYQNPHELVLLWGELRARDVMDWPASPPEYGDYQELDSFLEVASVVPTQVTLTGGDQPERVQVATVSHNFFSVLATTPFRGRLFLEEDANRLMAPPDPQAGPPAAAVILGHGLWQRRFGGDEGIVGRTIQMAGQPVDVVGVLAPDFGLFFPQSTRIPRDIDLFVAVPIPVAQAPRRNVSLRLLARLQPGVTPAQAQAEMDAHWARMREEMQLYADVDYHGHVRPLLDDLVEPVRPMILALFGAVVLVLLIACSNVASLLLVRASARTQEMSIRAALGGSRGRLARQMLSECLVVGGLAAVVGVLLAQGAISALSAMRPVDLPRMENIGIDGTVLGFTVLASLLAVVLFGLIPALHGSRADLAGALQTRAGSGGAGVQKRLRSGLVVAEVALSTVLLIGAGLMLRSSFALARVDPGYNPENVLTFQAAVPPGRFVTADARMSLAAQLRESLAALPGVLSVGAVSPAPLTGLVLPGRAGAEEAMADESLNQQAGYTVVAPGYFETMETSVVEGRLFTANEYVDSIPVVMVDELLAEALWPGQSAVGQVLVARPGGGDPVRHEVVGVVEHQYYDGLTAPGEDAVYYPHRYYGARLGLTWMVRTGVPPLTLVPAVRRAVQELSSDTPLIEVRTMASYVEAAQAPTRFALMLIGFFALTAVLLAVVGLYGVLAYAVQQRTAEIGVRMAFGAEAAGILRMVLGQGMLLALSGILLGLAGALALTRFMGSILVGIPPTDPATFLSIAVLFTGVSALASYLPALRATRVDPVRCLQEG